MSRAERLPKRFLRPRQVAEMLSVSKSTVLLAIGRGDLKAHRLREKILLIKSDDLEKWLDGIVPIVPNRRKV